MPGNGVASYGDLLITSLVVLVGVCLAAFVVVKVVGRFLTTGRMRGAHLLDIVARMPLEPRRSLYVVEVAGKTLLVGTSEMGLSVLSELDGSEVRARTVPKQSFGDLVRNAWGKRTAAPTHVGTSSGVSAETHVGTSSGDVSAETRRTHVGTSSRDVSAERRPTHVGTSSGVSAETRGTHVGASSGDVSAETRATHVGPSSADVSATHVGTSSADASAEALTTNVGTSDIASEKPDREDA
jgi:flagellar biogenesis protein FliO